MANKKSKNSKNTKAKTAKKTNEQIAVESAVNAAKKLHKKNPKLLIAIVAICGNRRNYRRRALHR